MLFDYITWTLSVSTLEGLRKMLDTLEQDGSCLLDGCCSPLENAMLVVEIAKLAEDRPEWFPKGKWATVQVMQEAVEEHLKDCLSKRGWNV